MSRARFGFAIGPAILAVLVAGCGGKNKSAGAEEHDHAHGEHADEDRAAPASFKEGEGLQLAAETAEALGLKTAEAELRKLAHAFQVTATVFDAGPPARATTLVPPEMADEWERHPPGEAKILSVRRDVSSALTQVEVVLALPGPAALGTTREVTLRAPERTALAVPRSAVLRTASGTFVYVVKGARLLRTVVKPAASDDAFVEIADGLNAGDVVVTAGAEQLWLTELRLTKGGGHSH
jgi:hypothetical protein